MKRSRFLIVMGILLGLALIGVIVILFKNEPFSFFPSEPTPEPQSDTQQESQGIPVSEVIVALQPIGRGFEIEPDSIRRRHWPAPNVPPDIIADESETTGKVATTEILQGQVIVRSMLINSSEQAAAPHRPAAADNMAYFSRNDGYLYALDAETGQEMWRFKPERSVFSVPAVANGLLYLVDGDGVLYAINAEMGQAMWRFAGIENRYTLEPAMPVISNGLVYFENHSDQFFYALDAVTGQERWRFDLHPIAGDTDEHIYAIDEGGNVYTTPYSQDQYVPMSKTAIADRDVYFFSGYGNLHAVADALTGQVTEPATDRQMISNPVITNQPGISTTEVFVALQPIDRGAVVTAEAIGRRDWPFDFVPPVVIAYEAETIGKITRRKIAAGEVLIRPMITDPAFLQLSSSPIIFDGIVYLERDREMIYALDTRFNRTWSFPGHGPTVAQNKLFYFVDPPEGSGEGGPPPPPHSPTLYAVDAITNEELWQFDGFTSLNSTIVAEDDVIYFSEDFIPTSSSSEEAGDLPPPPTGLSLYALDAQTGQEKWRFRAGEAVLSAPAVADNNVYISDRDGRFYAVDVETGQERWRVRP